MRIRCLSGLLCLGVICAPGPGSYALAEESESAAQRPAIIPVEVFAERSAFSSPLLSADGARIAGVVSTGEGTGITVFDSTTRKVVTGLRLGKEMEYNWHRWAGSKIVLVSVAQMKPYYGTEIRVSRLVALDAATGEKWFIGPKFLGLEGDDVLHVSKDGTNLLLSYQTTIFDWPGVARISLLDPKDEGTIVQRPVDGVSEWFADDAGVVRMGMGWRGTKVRVTYRLSEGEKFREIARIGEDDEDKFWDVSRIVGGSDEGLVLKEDETGRVVLSRYNLATREKIETIYRQDRWDLTRALVDDDGKALAVEFTDDRDRLVWLDPAMAKTQAQLEKALKADEVWVHSRAENKSRMLVYTGGETDPGAYYIYDPAARKLDLFAILRPKVDIATLARPKPITYTARDGTQISGYLTLPRGRKASSLPLIVMPHGGPYGVRDKLEYNDEVQFLANRGYAVLQPNYRGSGGYGKQLEEMGTGQIGRAMQDDLDDAMDWAVGEGIADARRVCVIGASYGGYAAMWAVLRNPDRYRCAASFAGVTDWKAILAYDSRFLSRKGAKKWKSRIKGESEFDLDAVAPTRRIASLSRPLLVAHGKLDTTVPFSQFKSLMAAADRANVKVEQIVFEEQGHGFDKPEEQAKWLSGLEKFLAAHNPAD